ncbi:hypothetical protein ACOMHN_056503 [Nucella lapillus]
MPSKFVPMFLLTLGGCGFVYLILYNGVGTLTVTLTPVGSQRSIRVQQDTNMVVRMIEGKDEGEDAAGRKGEEKIWKLADNKGYAQTSDRWPVFSKKYNRKLFPPSPFHPNFTIRWDFNTSAFLQRPDVIRQFPKLMTWMVKTRYMLPLPEPVRLRVCPEMPCLLTTNRKYRAQSSALIWSGQIMRSPSPPERSHPGQVFVFHNHEPQTRSWIYSPSFRRPAWRSAFNWTMHYRFDSDIVDLYGYIAKRETPLHKNYTDIVQKKTRLAAWLVSHCTTSGKRTTYVKLLQRYIPVDIYGDCSQRKCPRNQDDACYEMINNDYKFYFAFESSFCKDYISEKFFRYLEADTVVVARGSNQYKKHAPSGIFINTADFNSTQELAKYLLYLDSHPEEYIKILKAKDQYQPLYEDWPIRTRQGDVRYMHYHYEAVSYCEMCRRLWSLDQYRKTVLHIGKWFDKGNCFSPGDLK